METSNIFLSKTLPYTLVYFYPKDDTPGCTLEAHDFTRLKQNFADLGVEIVGVSRDTEDSHEKFKAKQSLDITLISDTSEELHHQFGVIGEKNNYGKIIMGVIRSTFLLNSKNGEILKAWRSVRATGHAEKVLRETTSFLS